MKEQRKKAHGTQLILGAGFIGTGEHGKRLHFTYIHDKNKREILDSLRLVSAAALNAASAVISAAAVICCVKRLLISLPGHVLNIRQN